MLMNDHFLMLVHVSEQLTGGVQAGAVFQPFPLPVFQLVAAVGEHSGAVFKAELVLQLHLLLMPNLIHFAVDQCKMEAILVSFPYLCFVKPCIFPLDFMPVLIFVPVEGAVAVKAFAFSQFVALTIRTFIRAISENNSSVR